MKKVKNFLFLSLLLTIVSCQKKLDVSPTEVSQPANILSFSVASQIAKAYLQKHSIDSLKTVTIASKEVIQRNGIPYMYVFNAANQAGFVVLAAEKNYTPILAHNKSGSFSAGPGSPSGLRDWITSNEDYIDSARSNVWRNRHSIISICAWKYLEKDLQMPDLTKDAYLQKLMSEIQWPDNTAPNIDIYLNIWIPEPVVTRIGPLIGTTWGQGCDYNKFCPSGNECSHAPTGCVPTAMAQLMYYWKWPTNYAWDIPNMFPGMPTDETARLMSDIGTSDLGNSRTLVNYGPDFSYTEDVRETVPYVFLTHFGYSSCDALTPGNYSWPRISMEIESGRPVLLNGYNESKSFFGFEWNKGSAHLWIVEGVFNFSWYWPMVGTFSFTQFYCNWGWSGDSNGWYSQYAPVDKNRNYQYYKSILYNIQP